MKRDDYPNYLAAVAAYHAHDQRSLARCLENVELSLIEKNLIRARIEIRDTNYDRALELLQKTEPPNAFLSGEKWVLLGNLHFFRGDLDQAVVANLNALDHYRRAEDPTGQFFAAYNLSVDFSRLGHGLVADYHLDLAQSFARSPREQSLIYRALACRDSLHEEFKTACEYMDRAISLESSLSFNDRMALYSVAADVYFRSGKAGASLEILRQLYKDHRANRERARIEFEYKVLECYLAEKSLPSQPPPALEESKEYSLKWKILTALQSGQPDEAKKLWTQLLKQVANVYGPDFTCVLPSDERSMFMAYLRRWLSKDEPKTAPDFHPTGKLGLLHQVLWEARTPLSKEVLIEAIWKVPYETTYDLRFYKLIERLKKLSPYPLLTENRAYRYQRVQGNRSGK